MTQRQKNLRAWKEIRRQLVMFQKIKIYDCGIFGRIPYRTSQRTVDAIFNELEHEAKRIGTFDNTNRYYWPINKRGLTLRLAFVNRQISKLSKKVKK